MNKAVASRSSNHGLTLIECLCVLVIIGILLALAIPSLRQARVEARRLLCISNAAQVNKLVLLYTGENKGSFLSRFPDDAAYVDTPIGFSRFEGQTRRWFRSEPWLSFSGLAADAPALRCPASPYSVAKQMALDRPRDFRLTAATIIDPGYLNPALRPADWIQSTGARLQRIDNVTFPSAKALTFEENVWHAFAGAIEASTDLQHLEWWGTPSPITSAFADGSAELLSRSRIGVFVMRAPRWESSPFQTTASGVRGRDR